MKFINQLCILILLDKLEGCSPDYIQEKMRLLDADEAEGLGALDEFNLARFVRYCKLWRVELPEYVKKMLNYEIG